MNKKVYLIDSNSLITPFNLYYALEFGSLFWDNIKQHVDAGDIMLLDMVKEECIKKKDALTEWFEEFQNIINHRTKEYVFGYTEVLQYIQDNPCYSIGALNAWSQETVADPWLIAVAKAEGYTIVTFELHHGNLTKNQPTPKVKIPDVAEHFGVETIDLFEMMHELELRLC